MRAFRQAKRMAFSMNARYVQGLESLSGMTISFARKRENIDPHAIRRGTRPARETGMNEWHGEPWARRAEPRPDECASARKSLGRPSIEEVHGKELLELLRRAPSACWQDGG